MDTQEFYIRHASETEARGPFSLEQLISLAATGGVTADSLYYDANAEQWASIRNNPAVIASVFPEKKKLSIKAKDDVLTLNRTKTDSSAPITVDAMLAAAEGRTAETKNKIRDEFAASRAAAAGMWALVAMFLVSATGSMFTAIDVIKTMDPAKIAAHPLALLGAIDLIFAVLLGLGLVSLYPLVRIRAACGIGFFGLIFFLQGDHGLMLGAIAGGAGLYLCTVCISLLPTIIATAAGLGGLGYVAYAFNAL